MSWWYLVHGFYTTPNISSLDTRSWADHFQPDARSYISSEKRVVTLPGRAERFQSPQGVLECEQPWGELSTGFFSHGERNGWLSPLRDRSWGSKKWLQFQNTVLYQARWWFQILFIFTPILGENFHFDQYFSNGLKPPTSRLWFQIFCFHPKFGQMIQFD